jgi:hypothetical protein
MEIKVTTPEEKKGLSEKLFKNVIESFENSFVKEPNNLNHYFLVVVRGEFDRNVCDKIQEIYLNAGWEKVICKTSSENGERGGLTSLKLWRTNPDNTENDK